MPIRTAVAQTPVVGHSRYAPPSGLLIDERASRIARGRDRGNLYVLVEVSGEEAGRDIIAMQLAATIHDVYYSLRGSITSGMQQAIAEANSLLFDENRNSLPGQQRTGGVSCIVLRNDDLFVAQAGPAAAYLAQEGKIARFPDVSPWLDDVPAEEMDAASLGTRRDVNVFLFHTQVGDGDTLLLLESEPARSVPKTAWGRILNSTPVETVMDMFLGTGQSSDQPAMALRLGIEGHKQAPIQQPAPAPSAVVNPPGPNPIVLWMEQLHLGERLQTAGRALVSTVVSLAAIFFTLVRRLVPGRPGPQPDLEEPKTIKSIASAVAAPRKKPRERSESFQKVLIAVAVAIPLIVAAIVLIIYFQRGQSQRSELNALWQEANALWEQAQITSDPASVRTLLNQADGLINELLKKHPDYPEAMDLHGRIQARQDELNQVRRINWIATLQTYPAGADLTRVVVEGAHIFVMDRNAGRVYHHQLDDYQQALTSDSRDTILLSKGDQIGNIFVGDLVDMVWMPVGNNHPKANLLILESGGSLIEYDPTTEERASLQIAGTENWQYPELVGSYYGRFYLLDPTANRIWRYIPTPDGYSNPPDSWLQAEVDLAGVVDMAIGNSIFLIYADGKLQKLTAGVPVAFDISDWDTPPDSPTALFTRPPEETQYVYVADRGHSRIVQANKDGRFERQFRLADPHTADGSDPLGGVSSLFVDEISGHAFFLSNQTLYLAILPD